MARKLTLIERIFAFGMMLQLCSGSSIPIWEKLSANEKVTILYNIFADQVSNHCKVKGNNASLVTDCKINLIKYGLDKLRSFTNDDLNELEPYQRDGHNLIWQRILEDHPTIKVSSQALPAAATLKSQATPTNELPFSIIHGNLNSNNRKNPILDDNLHGSSGSSSSYATNIDSEYKYSGQQYPAGVAENTYTEPINHVQQQRHKGFGLPINSQYRPSQQTSYLTGPSVAFLNPDGSPVKGSPILNSGDDDLEDYRFYQPSKQNGIRLTQYNHRQDPFTTYTRNY